MATTPEHYQNLIVGSGEGGKCLAWHLAKSGKRTAVVERRWVGGSCPNINCLPSKNEIWSAKVADLVHHANRFGVSVNSSAVDMAGVRKRKHEMVDGLVALHLDITRVEGQSGAGVRLIVKTSSGEKTIAASDILVAAGRTPNTAGIGLESAGVELDQHGYIKVNERLETTAPNIWAIGECAGSPQFTHASLDDFRIIRDNLAGGNRSTRDRTIPSCLFTDPPVAHIGLTETEAQRRGIMFRVAKIPL